VIKDIIYKTIYFIPIALSVGMILFSCENDINEINRLTNYENLPVQTIIDSEISYTKDTKVEFTVQAGQIDRYPDVEEPHDEFSHGVRVTTFGSDGEFESQIDAENASNFTDKKLMIARDSVVLKNFEGKMLQTELLTWDDEAQKIYTDQFVKITTPTEILYGDGLDAKPDFSEYEIRNIKGRIKIDTEENEEK
jgi:LPS export ABC transporter protein LptC